MRLRHNKFQLQFFGNTALWPNIRADKKHSGPIIPEPALLTARSRRKLETVVPLKPVPVFLARLAHGKDCIRRYKVQAVPSAFQTSISFFTINAPKRGLPKCLPLHFTDKKLRLGALQGHGCAQGRCMWFSPVPSRPELPGEGCRW